MPILNLRYEPLGKMENRILKRLFDVVFSGPFSGYSFSFCLSHSWKYYKVDFSGPVFFKQMRTGLNGGFLCYKFRSMKVNDEANSKQATVDDPRKTRFETFSVVLILTNFLSLSMSLRVICR